MDCASRVEGELCAPAVQECLRKVVDSVPHPTHATNVLKLLSGEDRDALEVKHCGEWRVELTGTQTLFLEGLCIFFIFFSM